MKAVYLSTFSSIKHLLAFGSDPILTMQKIRKKYGDFVAIKFGKKRIFLCFHPDLASDVFQNNHASFRKLRAVFDQIIPLTGKRGLVQLEGKEGLTQRRFTIKAFSSTSLPNYLERFGENFTIFRNEIHKQIEHEIKHEQEKTIDLAPHLARLVLSNALSMIVGDFDRNIIDEFLKDFLLINELCGTEIRRKSSLSFFMERSHTRQIQTIEKRLGKRILQLVAAAKFNSKECLISHLLQTEMDNEQIEHHVRTFLFAGFETTTSSILMTLYLLAQYPDVKKKIQNEIISCNLLEISALKSQRLLLNSYKESLRLYPPSWTLAREAVQTTVMGSEKICPGDSVFFGLNEMHRHETFWDNAHEFKPERFNQEGRHEFAFLPFGAGSRICIGMQTAYIEACYVLGAFLREFDIRIPEGFIPEIRAQITAHPANGLPVYITKVRTYV